MARRVEAFEWHETPLGRMSEWPESLCTAVRMVLENPFPQALLWGPELIVCAYNDAYAPILGERTESLGRGFLDLWDEGRDLIEPALRRAIAGGSSRLTDARGTALRNGDAETGHFDYAFSPVRDSSGTVFAVLNTVMEKTADLSSANKLCDNEQLYRLLFENMGEGFALAEMIWDERGSPVDWRYLEVNEAWSQTGVPAAETVGRTAREVNPGIEPYWIETYGRVVQTGEPVRYENYAASFGKWFETFAFKHSENRFALLFRDVTERKAAEEALRQSQATLSAVLDTMPVAVIIADREGRLVRDNALNRELWGIPPETASWEQYRDWVGWWPETGERIQAHEWGMARALLDGEIIRNELILNQRFNDSQRRYYLNNAAPLRDDEGRIIGGVVAQLDVTDRVAAEEALRQADRAKDEFLAILGHELRNPLAPLQTGIDLLERAPGNPEVLDRIVPMMRRQLSHLVHLVDDLLDISRISRGKIELQTDSIDLNVPIEAAVDQVRRLIDKREHQLHYECADRLIVNGDIERLTQVVGNLLSNAAKYTEPGGAITIATWRETDQAAVSVRDTGRGIASADLARVFELFSQIAEPQGRDGSGGLGVGLALSRQLVEMHGGTIEARSEGLGHGSEFVVRLPLSRVD